MENVRRFHLNLGLALAPLLLLFSVSGAWQALDLHKTPKGGSYRPAAIVEALSNLHTHQQAARKVTAGMRSRAFQVLSLVLGLAVASLALLGIAMAFRGTRRKWVPTGILLLGIAVPALLLAVSGA